MNGEKITIFKCKYHTYRQLISETDLCKTYKHIQFMSADCPYCQIEVISKEVERLKEEPKGWWNSEHEIKALKERIKELTQGDPAWYDMNEADAFRMWAEDKKKLQACNEQLSRYEEENESFYAINEENKELKAKLQRYERSFEAYGFTDNGGELLKPPVQNSGVIEGLLNKLQRYESAVRVETRVYKCCNEPDCVIKGGVISMLTERKLVPFIGKTVTVLVMEMQKGTNSGIETAG